MSAADTPTHVATHVVPAFGNLPVTVVDRKLATRPDHVWVEMEDATLILIPKRLVRLNAPEPGHGAVVFHAGMAYQRFMSPQSSWLGVGSLGTYTWAQILAKDPDELPVVLRA